MDKYVDRRAALKDELSEAISDIHLSFDLWTAPNYMSILGVSATGSVHQAIG